ncbi:MAG: DUF4167 domain-containing protein [Hyphomicrobiaceae bacterium]|nr:DUF4167 domain-containing protein [Hyphomicrobiaceae bacterium]
MRQGQQNRRGRGRGRKNQNPLTRSYESSGPDVKIRGTAAHIAEKYMSLARDANSSGDTVMAENYLQHAEHYNRIIMAFREQYQQADGVNGSGHPHARMRSPSDDDGYDEDEDDGDTAMTVEPVGHDGRDSRDGEQPRIVERGGQRPREGRSDDHMRSDGRDQRDQRNGESHRHGQQRDRRFRDRRGPRPQGDRDRDHRGQANGAAPADSFGEQGPEFLRRPVRRRPRPDGEADIGMSGDDARGETGGQPVIGRDD